jgi:hypothetical protein
MRSLDGISFCFSYRNTKWFVEAQPRRIALPQTQKSTDDLGLLLQVQSAVRLHKRGKRFMPPHNP